MNTEFITSWFNATPALWIAFECLGALAFIVAISILWHKMIDSSIKNGIEKKFEAPQYLSEVINRLVHLSEELENCAHSNVNVRERLSHLREHTSAEKWSLRLDLLKIVLPNEAVGYLFGFFAFVQGESNRIDVQIQDEQAEQFLKSALRKLEYLIGELYEHENKVVPFKQAEEA